MKYKGIELKEITEPQIFDPPKEMLVWDYESCSSNAMSKKKVLAILPNKKEYRQNEIRPVLATDGTKWNFCANVPAPRRATNRELAKWLAEGKGVVKCGCRVLTSMGGYDIEKSNDTCAEWLNIQKWDDAEWHEPTAEYMGLEG